MARPNLFLVGAPRCGTTTLHHYLAQHPAVFMSTPKEPHYFCSDIHRELDAHQGGARDPLFREEEQYLRLFEAATTEPIRGESSVYYLYSEEAARGIARFAPDARIVVMLRDPLEFLRSLHAKLLWAGDEDQASFERALDLEPRRRRGEAIPRSVRFPSFLFYSRYADFARWIELYREHFPPERLKVLYLDDFQRETEAVYHDVLDFLGVERLPLPADAPRNANAAPRFGLLTRYLRRPGRRRRPRLDRLLWRLNTKNVPRRPLDQATQARLRQRLRPGVERLSEVLGEDLVQRWGYGDGA
jgi:hypothetical protein